MSFGLFRWCIIVVRLRTRSLCVGIAVEREVPEHLPVAHRNVICHSLTLNILAATSHMI